MKRLSCETTRWRGPVPCFSCRTGGVFRGEASALFVEQELENLVGAEMRDEDETVRVVDADRVRIARGWHNLQRLADPAVRADWVHAYEIGSVGRPEKKSTATVERDGGRAFR